jgi:cell fate (sporulation/competence/biofilm development) regulator YlbF (YheA/YmcA/DUF963 family)
LDELERIMRRKMEQTLDRSRQEPLKGRELLNHKAEELAEAILESAEYITFERVQRQLQYDPTAQKLMEDFQQKQQSLLLSQQMYGGVDQAELGALQQLRLSLQQNVTVSRYLQVQQNLSRLVQKINEEFSRRTGVNITPSGGSC